MKIALCFIISYNHILNKEDIWRKWIDENKDIINVYFFYKDLQKIKSPWILKHIVDPSYIQETSYFHVVPAYLSVLTYAFRHSNQNKWFCLLTESCCPIISPRKFRKLFFSNYSSSIMSWTSAWWNVNIQKRANLAMLPKSLHLANVPYFILKREDVDYCLRFPHINSSLFKIICDGGLANESIFVILFFIYKRLQFIKNKVTHLTDWSRMSSSTSPHLFNDGNKKDIQFIENALKQHTFAMFIRKISPDFPDKILNDFIYLRYKEDNNYWLYMKYFFIVIFIHLFIFFSLIHPFQ